MRVRVSNGEGGIFLIDGFEILGLCGVGIIAVDGFGLECLI